MIETLLKKLEEEFNEVKPIDIHRIWFKTWVDIQDKYGSLADYSFKVMIGKKTPDDMYNEVNRREQLMYRVTRARCNKYIKGDYQ